MTIIAALFLTLVGCSSEPDAGDSPPSDVTAPDAVSNSDSSSADPTSLDADSTLDQDGAEASETTADAETSSGPDSSCIQANIQVAEGAQVLPQTVLHLDGSQSGGDGSLISAYEWTVEQPVNSVSSFSPNNAMATPTFVANVVGEYTFKLTVWDEFGAPNCEPAVTVVTVQAAEGIHIELLWTTAGDPDQTNQGPEAGADMDLHFAHWLAVGQGSDEKGEWNGWFDQPFDCFWFNSSPNWGNLDSMIQDDPGLDLDDTDGVGPEILNLSNPENTPSPDDRYRVGVHYWSDHGYGPSVPMVRIYISGTLAYSVVGPPMKSHTMWFVGEISWPDGELIPYENSDGSPKVIQDYTNPFIPN